MRRLADQRIDPTCREWGIRHLDGKVTVQVDGHAFGSRTAADTERVTCDQDFDTCNGGTHTLVYRDRHSWQAL